MADDSSLAVESSVVSDPEYDRISSEQQFEYEIPHRSAYKHLGFFYIIVGCICFIFELVGVILNAGANSTFSGIYAGVLIILAGGLSLFASHRNSKRFVIISSAAAVVCMAAMIVAIIFVHREVNSYIIEFEEKQVRVFHKVKCYVVLGACSFEIVLLIAHFMCFISSICCNKVEEFDRVRLVFKTLPDSNSLTVPTPDDFPGPSGVGFLSFQTTVQTHSSVEHI